MSLLSKNLVVVAMSGGVDSSVAALLLKEQGMEVIGISMKTHETVDKGPSAGTFLDRLPQKISKSCCTASDINDARRVCQQLDVPFYAMNFKDEFEEKVIRNFVQEYGRGRTPNPCVQCNSHIKFSALLQEARRLGAYYLATGHYAQRSRDRYGRYHLLKARDRAKDQTYFLFGLGQGELEHSLFPVGKYTKEEVRGFARTAGLKTAEKEESQEICFIPDNDYAGFVEERLPERSRQAGSFVTEEGRSLGVHRGIHAYTIGQRRGLGVAEGHRMYVTSIVPEENKVVLGAPASLLRNGLIAKEVRWVNREMVTSGAKVEVKIRHRHPGCPSILWIEEDSTVRLEFQSPEGPIAPGQAAVFYLGEELVGGGWIEKGL